MKKLIKNLFVLVFVISLATSVYAKNFSAWLLGNDDSLSIRAGYNISQPIKIEMGIEFYPCLKVNNISDACIALYATYKPIPETAIGTPYIGIQTGFNVDNQGTFAGPIIGVVVGNVLVIEYQYISADFDLKTGKPLNEQSVLIGLRFEF